MNHGPSESRPDPAPAPRAGADVPAPDAGPAPDEPASQASADEQPVTGPGRRTPVRAARDRDPEDWAASSGTSDEWLLKERPPHW